MNRILTSMAWLLTFLLAGCTGVPEGITPVSNFQLDRYLGKWYEIARLDHSFERDMSDVSAVYSLHPDGGVRVINRGYRIDKWKSVEGKAELIDPELKPAIGSLKVSFFGPFYGGYHIIALDPDYRWSMVAGPDRDYLWILARERSLPPAIQMQLVETAKRLGFDTDKLIWVGQTRPDA